MENWPDQWPAESSVRPGARGRQRWEPSWSSWRFALQDDWSGCRLGLKWAQVEDWSRLLEPSHLWLWIINNVSSFSSATNLYGITDKVEKILFLHDSRNLSTYFGEPLTIVLLYIGLLKSCIRGICKMKYLLRTTLFAESKIVFGLFVHFKQLYKSIFWTTSRSFAQCNNLKFIFEKVMTWHFPE